MSSDAAVILKAVRFSADRHRSQRRKGEDASPYINHPLEVADLLANVGGVTDVATLLAAVLHDTVEDTETTLEEIGSVFGRDVRSLVEELTDDKRLPKAERKSRQIEHAPHLMPGAKMIKIADKISNVRDVTYHPPAAWPVQRRREYIEWARQVVAGCRGSNAELEQRFDEVVAEAWSRLGRGD